MEKNLTALLKEQENTLKTLQARKRAGDAILKVYPDAYMSELEGGKMAYFSASIKPNTDKAQPEIMYGGQGRHILRIKAKVGKENVYSKDSYALENSQVTEMLNQLINFPSGRAALAKLWPAMQGNVVAQKLVPYVKPKTI